ncbi:MAG: regulatory signaling modulator protein AmpE [Burkholderiales bacterium]|jgi:adenosylcobinamide-phosphate synthase|nr:regulatory signaling modulator protein AmpE [Burkholderiales bacterium]
MKFLAILVVLGLEQWHSANWRGGVERLYVGYLRWLETGMIRWGTWPATAVALLPVLLVIMIDVLAAPLWLLMLVWSMVVLYLLMGFRRFSHAVTEITESLRNGDLPMARKTLYDWQGGDSLTLGSDDIALRTIEAGALAAYRCVFGVVFWFMVFGPSGAVFYWMLTLIAREWSESLAGEDITMLTTARAELGRVARWLLFIVDWLPVRLLAFSFAVVGDFEDAMYQWRALPNDDAAFDGATNENVLLATAFGALGLTWVRRVPPAPAKNATEPATAFAKTATKAAESEKTLGPPPESVPVTPDVLPSAIGLVWRALLFWLGLVLLLTVAYWS